VFLVIFIDDGRTFCTRLVDDALLTEHIRHRVRLVLRALAADTHTLLFDVTMPTAAFEDADSIVEQCSTKLNSMAYILRTVCNGQSATFNVFIACS
jgi:hypothetical protein